MTAVACSADRVAAGDAGGDLYLCDAGTGANRRLKLPGGKDFRRPYDRVQFTPDGSLLFLIREARGGLWFTRPDDPGLRAWGAGGNGTRFLDLSADCRVWLEANGRSLTLRPNLYLRDDAAGAGPDHGPVAEYEQDIVHAVPGPPEGGRVAVLTADGDLRLYERGARPGRGRGDPAWTARLGRQPVSALGFSPDGRRLAVVGADGFARVYDAAAGRRLAALAGHRGSVDCVAFGPAGRTVATGGEDGVVRLWDAEGGRPLAALEGHRGAIRAVAFGPTGETLVTGSADRTLRGWRQKD